MEQIVITINKNHPCYKAKAYFIVLYFLIYFIPVKSQPDLKFSRYTARDGIAHNDINCIIQDHLGFLWFGTNDGISRFDGIHFKTWHNFTKNDTSFSIGIVNDVILDKDFRLWFAIPGEKHTLLSYDYQTDRFIDFSEQIKQKLNITNSFNIWSIYQDSSGLIWLSTRKGPVFFNPENMDVQFKKLHKKSTDGSITDFIEDENKNMWIATTSGLFLYDKNNDSVISFYHDPKNINSISSSNCNCIFRDSEKNIWIGTFKGVNKVIKTSEGHYNFNQALNIKKSTQSSSGYIVVDISEDENKNLLLATLDGLCLYNKNNKTLYRYNHDEINSESINANLIRTVYVDKYYNIWLGTISGAAKLQKKNFRSFTHSSYKNSISHNKIEHLCEAQNDELWIANPKGIDAFGIKRNKFRNIAHITNSKEGLHGPPLSLYPGKEKAMWVGTWNGGYSKINYVTGEIDNFISDNKVLSISNVLAIIFDSKNNLWVSSHGKGLYMYNEQKNYSQFYVSDIENDNSLSSNYITSIFEDSDSTIWVGTINGINKLVNTEGGEFIHFFKNSYINHIVESKSKNLWIGTNTGLYRLNRNTGEYILYSVNQGLPGNNIMGVLEDQSENLWLSSNKGFFKIAFKGDSIQNITIFREDEGLSIGNFISGSCTKLSNGTMAFGGSDGFCLFNPSKVKEDTIIPQTYITSLKVAGNEVKVGGVINGQILLQKSITITNQLAINYKNNSFTLGFSGLQYNMPQYNQFSYHLEGYDEKSVWHITDATRREVTYMNLPGGTYTFQLKASNSYGVWNQKPIKLSITIIPPWWQTWWFRIGSFCLFIIITFAIYRYRINILKKQKRILEQKVSERTAELREANSQLEEKQEEIMQQNEEILSVNEELKTKNEEITVRNSKINAQKEELVVKNQEIEESKIQLEKAFKNIKIISEFGQKLTATFNFDEINSMIYNYVSSLMEISAFGVGIYNEKRNIIDFPYFIEKGKPQPYFFKPINSEKSLTVKCFTEKREIVINELERDYKNYLEQLPEISTQKLPRSMVFLPLLIEGKSIGTLNVNSDKANAYNTSDVDNLRTLASYFSIALDNSRAYRLVNRQKEQITGSIIYGQTIQQAMLPPNDLMNKYFENFILFRPKDIVSGDFYWMSALPELKTSFIAAVDCTGHGVPGAFMSMIGMRLLNEIVNEMHIYDPKEILEKLDLMTVNSLRQKETSNNDGMDISLVKISGNGNEVSSITYAGAKRPLIYSDGEIKVIEGTRRSIGGFGKLKKHFPFENNEMKLGKGAILYLSTDGFTDQCNPDRKKIGQKFLLKKLSEIKDLSMEIQMKRLSGFLDDYQAGYLQRDDITIIGIKL